MLVTSIKSNANSFVEGLNKKIIRAGKYPKKFIDATSIGEMSSPDL